jgi:hypothetical protein
VPLLLPLNGDEVESLPVSQEVRNPRQSETKRENHICFMVRILHGE